MISFPNPIRISADGNVSDFDEEARRGEAIIYVVGFVLLAPEVEGGAGFQALFFTEEPVIGTIDIMLFRLAYYIRMVVGLFLAVQYFVAARRWEWFSCV